MSKITRLMYYRFDFMMTYRDSFLRKRLTVQRPLTAYIDCRMGYVNIGVPYVTVFGDDGFTKSVKLDARSTELIPAQPAVYALDGYVKTITPKNGRKPFDVFVIKNVSMMVYADYEERYIKSVDHGILTYCIDGKTLHTLCLPTSEIGDSPIVKQVYDALGQPERMACPKNLKLTSNFPNA